MQHTHAQIERHVSRNLRDLLWVLVHRTGHKVSVYRIYTFTLLNHLYDVAMRPTSNGNALRQRGKTTAQHKTIWWWPWANLLLCTQHTHCPNDIYLNLMHVMVLLRYGQQQTENHRNLYGNVRFFFALRNNDFILHFNFCTVIFLFLFCFYWAENIRFTYYFFSLLLACFVLCFAISMMIVRESVWLCNWWTFLVYTHFYFIILSR